MPNSKQIVYLSQTQYAELIANGTITVDGVTVTYDENDIYVTPQAEPVTDVRVAGTSVAANGVANIPVGTNNIYGVAKGREDRGINLVAGVLELRGAPVSIIKTGNSSYLPIVTSTQHQSVFYGLSKVAGVDLASETVTLGTYPDASKAAIQSMLGVSDLIATSENTLVASKAYAVGDVFTANGKLYKATAAIAANDSIITQDEGETISGANAVETKVGEGFPHDVQVNGVSVVTDGVANVPKGGLNVFGAVSYDNQYGNNGIVISNGAIRTSAATNDQIKTDTNGYRPIVPTTQHLAVFYGLAKAAGDTTQKASSNAVGTYTDNAKAAIKAMLGIQDGSTGTVDVTGTTPTITAVENTRYVCGEVTSLNFTPAASGICIVRFTSGSTVTVLTLPSTVKFPEWFDPTSLETNTIYEICVTDGVYGAVMSWAQ